jgi:hypothetical protein
VKACESPSITAGFSPEKEWRAEKSHPTPTWTDSLEVRVVGRSERHLAGEASKVVERGFAEVFAVNEAVAAAAPVASVPEMRSGIAAEYTHLDESECASEELGRYVETDEHNSAFADVDMMSYDPENAAAGSSRGYAVGQVERNMCLAGVGGRPVVLSAVEGVAGSADVKLCEWHTDAAQATGYVARVTEPAEAFLVVVGGSDEATRRVVTRTAVIEG